MREPDEAFGVYVHWPFCLSKCPYCDFNSHVRHAAIDEPRFLRAFQTEIASTAAQVPGRTVSSIFLGGGTPSLMQPQTVGSILDAIAKHWRVAGDVEVTLEANPTSVEATRFRGYRAAGVNRVSLGVQALNDAELKSLGRLHTAQEALDAVAIARKAFERDKKTLRAMGVPLHEESVSNDSRYLETINRYEHRFDIQYYRALDALVRFRDRKIVPHEPTDNHENKRRAEIADPTATHPEPQK